MARPGSARGGQPPSLRLRRLAAELRTLRQDARLTRDTAAQRTELNSATLWRIETGRARPQRRTLLALMDLYGVRDERRRTELLGLAQPAAAPDGRPIPAGHPSSDGYDTLVHFEPQARRVRLFESRFVPDPLQTERYARAVLAGAYPDADPDELDRLLTARARRRTFRTADPPIESGDAPVENDDAPIESIAPPTELTAVIDESALHRRVGGGRVHRDQLRELARVARLPQVTLRVLPYRAGAHAGLHGGFTILEFPDPADPGLVCVETVTGPSLLEEPAELAGYLARFDRLCALALDPDRSRAFVAGLLG